MVALYIKAKFKIINLLTVQCDFQRLRLSTRSAVKRAACRSQPRRGLCLGKEQRGRIPRGGRTPSPPRARGNAAPFESQRPD